MDVTTVVISLMALALYVAKEIVTINLNKQINATRMNTYIRLTNAGMLNKFYEYMVSITVFTSTIRFSRLLSFQKAFMQIMATMKLCFQVRSNG